MPPSRPPTSPLRLAIHYSVLLYSTTASSKHGKFPATEAKQNVKQDKKTRALLPGCDVIATLRHVEFVLQSCACVRYRRERGEGESARHGRYRSIPREHCHCNAAPQDGAILSTRASGKILRSQGAAFPFSTVLEALLL